jgi:NADPH:quinone reductase-like Zn-dependent oxidoreductase
MVFRRHGGAEALEPAEMPIPEPGPGEVRIALRAAALNHLDIWARNGLGVEIPMPHIGGSDGAGVIDGAGPNVPERRLGEGVLIAPGLCCGRCPECLAGRESRCASFRIVGFQTQGTYATHVAVPEANAIPVPPGMTFTEAAAVPLVFLTAHHMLFARAGLRPGETVYVPGAASGVGSAAVQLASAAGARVVASAGSPEKLALARSLGAHETFLTGAGADERAEIRRLTGGRGADVVVDHVGGDHVAASAAMCARGGRVAVCGATAGPAATLPLRSLYVPEVSVLGTYMGSRWELLEVLKLFAQRRLRAVVDRVLPLAQAAEAQRLMEARKNLGKLVLEP